MVNKVDEGPQDCPGCGGTYSNENSLRDHLNRCDKDAYFQRYGRKAKVYKCPEVGCPYVTDGTTNMSHHMRSHHSDEAKPKCPSCDLELSGNTALRTHLNACDADAFRVKYKRDPLLYTCDVCVDPVYSTMSRSTFSFHMRKEHDRGVNAELHVSSVGASGSSSGAPAASS